MDRIRTLLLARTSMVVLDRDRVASAATRPSRDGDVEKFEDELAQLGYVMSLDLAMTIRRLPFQAIQELKTWMLETLAKELGHRPQVPLFRFPETPSDSRALFRRRILAWLFTRAEQPCPWCARVVTVGSLDPCGHLVCRTCWAGGTYAGCPICHRRISLNDPFVLPAGEADAVQHNGGELRLLHLAFDVVATAEQRFQRLVSRATPLSKDDRTEIETVIDVMGPRAAIWLPSKIAARETMAIAVARLWMVSPDRIAMMKATQGHLRTATDVLRVATVLMGGDPGLEPVRLSSIGRGLRRAVLEAMERLAIEPALEDMSRHRGAWQRVGERLHPFEHAERLPNVAMMFAVLRETDLAAATFGDAIRKAAATIPAVRISDNRARVARWAAPVEEALRTGDAARAVTRLWERPDELVRRTDHVVRVAPPDQLADVLAGVKRGIERAAPAMLLTLGAHVAKRGAAWPRRLYLPKNKTWRAPDLRPPLGAETIGAIVDAVRGELLARAEQRRQFARAVIDRGLADRLLTLGALRRVGGYRAELAEIGARPTLWDVAALHAAARANIVYVRERDDTYSTFRRRDGESTLARLARIHGGDHDAHHTRIPPAQAPTWVALLRDDIALPAGSAGYVLSARRSPTPTGDAFTRVAVRDLIAELAKP